MTDPVRAPAILLLSLVLAVPAVVGAAGSHERDYAGGCRDYIELATALVATCEERDGIGVPGLRPGGRLEDFVLADARAAGQALVTEGRVALLGAHVVDLVYDVRHDDGVEERFVERVPVGLGVTFVAFRDVFWDAASVTVRIVVDGATHAEASASG